LIPGLSINSPNPFSEFTTISFTSGGGEKVVIEIYNVLGEKVKTLVNEVKAPGHHEIEFRADGVSNGIYYCRMQHGKLNQVVKMVKLD